MKSFKKSKKLKVQLFWQQIQPAPCRIFSIRHPLFAFQLNFQKHFKFLWKIVINFNKSSYNLVIIRYMSRYYKNSSIRISLCPCNEEVKKKYYFYFKKKSKILPLYLWTGEKKSKDAKRLAKRENDLLCNCERWKAKTHERYACKKTYVSEIT